MQQELNDERRRQELENAERLGKFTEQMIKEQFHKKTRTKRASTRILNAESRLTTELMEKARRLYADERRKEELNEKRTREAFSELPSQNVIKSVITKNIQSATENSSNI